MTDDNAAGAAIGELERLRAEHDASRTELMTGITTALRRGATHREIAAAARVSRRTVTEAARRLPKP